MKYQPAPGRSTDAAKALVHLSALDDLVDRDWLTPIAEPRHMDACGIFGWEITDGHYFATSSGEKALLDLLDGICTDTGVHLSLLGQLDERNRLAAVGAVGLLLGVDREAA